MSTQISSVVNIYVATVIIILFVTISNITGKTEWDDGCYLDTSQAKVQAAFVIDKTGTNVKFIDILGSSLESIVKGMTKKYGGGVEFALTTHANWPQKAIGGLTARHNIEEECYVLDAKFTNKTDDIITAAKNIKYVFGGAAPNGWPDENAIAAVAFAAADMNMGWIRTQMDAQGRNISRILILCTDQYSHFFLNNPGTRTPFKGDGSDTCEHSLHPSFFKLGEVLENYDAHIIGVYLRKGILERYEAMFKKHGYGERHQGKFVGEPADTDEFRNNLENLIVETTPASLRCVWLDPPGYLTLGL